MIADFDVIVIGAGHNGLVCAAYLAKAGLSVCVLERSHRVGGACITEELYPGCQFSTFAYNANGPGPKICRDLEIPADAIKVTPANPSMFNPFPNGEHIFLWSDADKTAAELRRFNAQDADAFYRYGDFMSKAKQIAKDMFYRSPPSVRQLEERYLGTEFEPVLQAMLNRSLWSVIEEHFSDEHIKCVFARADDVGSPTNVGSLLAEVVESANDGVGVDGIAGIPSGGMGAVSAALAKAAERFGVEIHRESAVRSVVVENGVAVGVRLSDDRVLTGKHIVSNADPKRTFLNLVPADALDVEFRAKVAALKTRAGNMKFHAVLSGVPEFTAMPSEFRGDAKAIAGVRIAPTLQYIDAAWQDCLKGIPSREPVMSLQLPTAYWPELAPEGKHIFGAWIRYGPGELAQGTWDEWRPRVAESVISAIESYAPGFRDLIEWHRLYTPADIQRETGITHGTIRHLDMTIDQMLHRRPLPPWSSYATPLNGLWLCGSGTHPCGSVTGAPGHNAAHAILESL